MPDEEAEGGQSAPFQQAPPELKRRKHLDFASTIARLEVRATAARRRARWAGALLVIGAYSIAGILSFSVVSVAQEYRLKERDPLVYGTRPVEVTLGRRIEYSVSRLIGPSYQPKNAPPFVPPSKEDTQQLKADIKDGLSDLEKAAQISEINRKADSQTSQVAPIVLSGVFSVGVVGILILLIQIALQFIRYHLRLAELYDAQADALRASGGDGALAHSMLQLFSPNVVEVGRLPTSLYEKAFDTVQAVAKRTSAP